ncbi:hypothetical protein MHTCC0001_10580 [Flavobacteriaceae bacterium MHTCC 0001]
MKVSFFRVIYIVFILLSAFQLKAQNDSNPPSSRTIEKIGDVVLYILPVATLGSTYLIGDKKGPWQFTKGLLFTEILTYGLKLGVDKPRPDMSNNNSFPSGHTSTTFHNASFIHIRYGFKYSIPSYVLAGFTAFSRVESNKHDVIDVIAGAVIGLASNLVFTTNYQKEQFQLTFNSSKNECLIGFTYKF